MERWRTDLNRNLTDVDAKSIARGGSYRFNHWGNILVQHNSNVSSGWRKHEHKPRASHNNQMFYLGQGAVERRLTGVSYWKASGRDVLDSRIAARTAPESTIVEITFKRR